MWEDDGYHHINPLPVGKDSYQELFTVKTQFAADNLAANLQIRLSQWIHGKTEYDIQARKRGGSCLGWTGNTIGHCTSLPDVECVSSVFHGYRAVSQKPDVDTDRQKDREKARTMLGPQKLPTKASTQTWTPVRRTKVAWRRVVPAAAPWRHEICCLTDQLHGCFAVFRKTAFLSARTA